MSIVNICLHKIDKTDPDKYEIELHSMQIRRKIRAYLNRGFLGNICPVFSCNATFPLKINSQLNRRVVISSSKASVIVCTFRSLKRKMPLVNIFRVVMGMAIPLCRRYLKHKKNRRNPDNQMYIGEQGQIFKL